MGQDKEIVPIIVDLGAARKGQLNESFLRMFGGWMETILKQMFGLSDVPIIVKGYRDEIEAFANALQKEKKYMDIFNQYGLSDPNTLKSRYALEDAIKSFEKRTGLIWPIK